MPQEFLNSLSFHVSLALGVRDHRAKVSKLGNHTSSGPEASSQISTVLYSPVSSGCCVPVAILKLNI